MQMPAALSITSQKSVLSDYRMSKPARPITTVHEPEERMNPLESFVGDGSRLPDFAYRPTLGVAPVLIAGAGAAGGAAVLAGGQAAVQASRPWYEAALQWLGIRPVPELPVNPSMPSNRAPIAPQTAASMVTWTPDDQLEAVAQANRQYGIDYAYYRQLYGQPIAGAAGGAENPTIASDSTHLWILGGLGAAFLFFALRK